MAKIIKLTPEHISEIWKDFEEAISSAKLSDGKINFTKSFGTIKREATIYFTEIAWLKMQTLIREFDKEVAWHGVAKRGDDPEKDEYYISDILVYPQQVTGANVETDQEAYQTWLYQFDDDVFNNIRFQGHSHVNMGTTPSSVDNALYDNLLAQLDENMFYIFMIYNKRGEKTVKIYDMGKNVLFETADCTVKILDDGTGIEQFLKDAKSKVKDRVYSAAAPAYQKNYGGNYTGKYSGNSSAASDKKEDKPHDPTPSKKDGKRKGKRKDNKNSVSKSQYALTDNYPDPWDYRYGGYYE